jgi:hypothetical protein
MKLTFKGNGSYAAEFDESELVYLYSSLDTTIKSFVTDAMRDETHICDRAMMLQSAGHCADMQYVIAKECEAFEDPDAVGSGVYTTATSIEIPD